MNEHFVPPIAIADPDDAGLLFNIVNAALCEVPFYVTGPQRARLNTLLINIHAEVKRARGETIVEQS